MIFKNQDKDFLLILGILSVISLLLTCSCDSPEPKPIPELTELQSPEWYTLSNRATDTISVTFNNYDLDTVIYTPAEHQPKLTYLTETIFVFHKIAGDTSINVAITVDYLSKTYTGKEVRYYYSMHPVYNYRDSVKLEDKKILGKLIKL